MSSKTKQKSTEIRDRKRRSTCKRVSSGLISKTIYIDKLAQHQLMKLAESCDYSIGKKGMTSEQLSMLITYLIDTKTLENTSSVPTDYKGQYLQRLYRVVKHRSLTMRDTLEEIVEFLKEYKYVVPESLENRNLPYDKRKYGWSEDLVQLIIDKQSVNQITAPSIHHIKTDDASKLDTYDDLDELDEPFEPYDEFEEIEDDDDDDDDDDDSTYNDGVRNNFKRNSWEAG
ncbi:TPA: hypothetical protein ACX6Q6_002937 [Photobacterium damselae]